VVERLKKTIRSAIPKALSLEMETQKWTIPSNLPSTPSVRGENTILKDDHFDCHVTDPVIVCAIVEDVQQPEESLRQKQGEDKPFSSWILLPRDPSTSPTVPSTSPASSPSRIPSPSDEHSVIDSQKWSLTPTLIGLVAW